MIALRALCGLFARVAAAKTHCGRRVEITLEEGPPLLFAVSGNLSPQDSMPLKALLSKFPGVLR
jgi:hypothetical protein